MEHRNIKGQILIEAIFLMGLFGSLFFIFQGLIARHQTEIKKVKLSHEIRRNYQYEDN